MAEENQLGAAKSNRNSSEEHKIDSFYGYLAHIKFIVSQLLFWTVILCSVES